MGIDKSKGGLTHLGTGTSFEGKITVPHELALFGEFAGEIECSGQVTIGVKGVVKANITAKSLVVGGHLEGTVRCSGAIELEESAVLIGDITSKELIINKGALFRGKSSMGEDGKKGAKNAIEPEL